MSTSLSGEQQGFGRELRLLTAADFKRVFDGAEIKVSHKHLLILTRSSELKKPRLGLVIAKKHIRFAVGRNLVKRISRETFRHRQQELIGLDIVVLARPGLNKLDHQELHSLLNKQWDRLSNKLQSK